MTLYHCSHFLSNLIIEMQTKKFENASWYPLVVCCHFIREKKIWNKLVYGICNKALNFVLVYFYRMNINHLTLQCTQYIYVCLYVRCRAALKQSLQGVGNDENKWLFGCGINDHYPARQLSFIMKKISIRGPPIHQQCLQQPVFTPKRV